MPTAFTHAIVPIALGVAAGRERVPRSLMAAGVVLALLPDLDVVALKLGVFPMSTYGHRGFTHSLCFAAATALLGAVAFRRHPGNHPPGYRWAAAFLLVCALSHPFLDALTAGSAGQTLLWPFSEFRFISGWRPIRVEHLSLSQVFSRRVLAVGLSELIWVWVPCLGLGAGARIWSRARRRQDRQLPGSLAPK